MKKIGLIGLILLFLLGVIFSSGCSITFDCCTPPTTPPITPPTILEECKLVIIAMPPEGWGWVVKDGVRTEHYIDYDCSANQDYYDAVGIDCKSYAILNVECRKNIEIQIEDICGRRSISYWILTVSGENIIVIDDF